MEKEDLLRLKKKLDNLSEEDKKARRLYLKKIANGEIQGPPVGYPSIDEPALKFYKDEPTKDIDDCKTIYDMVFKDKNPNDIAIEFLDGKCSWTYGKLQKVTDKCISAFRKFGVREGDNILYGVTNTPELIAALIATVSIGATAKFFDIRANANEIANYANSSKCKYMVCLDQIVLAKVKKVIDDTKFKKVWILKPANSLSLLEKLNYAIENREELKKSRNKSEEDKIPSDPRYGDLTKLIRKGNRYNSERVEYDPERPAIKVQSSGTTGKAKTIVHSEKSAVNFAKSISYTDLPLGPGKKVLVALPPWIAYGIGDAILMSLSLGSTVMLCADFEPNAVYRNIGNFTLSYAAPFHYRYLRDHYDELSSEEKKELAKVDCMIAGGDKYSAVENKSDEDLFGTVVLNGYGNNEDFGALSVNPFHNNKYGTVGVPKYGETAIVYDNENGVELPYGVEGEICTLSNTNFLGYENNKEATDKTMRLHPDGKYYLHTGDRGIIDEDGYIQLFGRNERVIVRLGFKISAYTIEDAITSLPYISECVAVEVPDEAEEHVPMVFVVPKKGYDLSDDQLINDLNNACKFMLKENEIPKYIKVEKEMKYTDNNKYDFRFYEKKGKEFVETFVMNVKNQNVLNRKMKK